MDNSFDSKEECYFDLWVTELLEHNLITEAKYQPKPFNLADDFIVPYRQIKQLKTKTSVAMKQVNIMTGHTYQADWILYWNPILQNILFSDLTSLEKSPKEIPFVAKWSQNSGTFFSVIDVKGNFNQNDAWRRFSIDQKWVYQRYNIYVNKVVVYPRIGKKGNMIPARSLFTETFLPQRMLLTDKAIRERKIRYPFILIDEFLKKNNLRVSN